MCRGSAPPHLASPDVIPGSTKDSLRGAELLSASRAWLSSACQGPGTGWGGLHSVPSACEPRSALTARKVNHIVWLRPFPAGGKPSSFSSSVRAQLEYCISVGCFVSTEIVGSWKGSVKGVKNGSGDLQRAAEESGLLLPAVPADQ